MKKVNPKIVLERILTVKRVWGTLRPNRSYYGITREEFESRIKPSLDARAELESIDEHRSATAVRRDDADAESMDLIKRIVNAIKADPAEGEDGEVYAALGYVRKGLRMRGRPRTRPESAATPVVDATDGTAKEGDSDKRAA